MIAASTPELADTGAVSVVVIGAGYAGVMATNRLLSSLTLPESDRVRVTVVNPRPEFVERIRLHELAAGSRRSVFLPLADSLHADARLLVGTARRIDSNAHTVTVATAEGDITEPYDYLIYAPGSMAASPISGAREHAHLVGDLDGAQIAAQQLSGLAGGSKVVIVGGGFTGVELAAEIAERRPTLGVTLLSSGRVAEQMRPHARRSIRRALTRMGVLLVEDTAADRITNRAVIVSDGRTVEFDSCLIALSFTAPDLARVSGLSVDPAGRLRTDETLRCTGAPDIIGAGDAIVTPESVGAHLRMSCAAALPLGGHAAETVLHLIRGEAPAPVSIGFVLQCVSLGRKDGYIQLVRADDTARAGRLTRRKAARPERTSTDYLHCATLNRLGLHQLWLESGEPAPADTVPIARSFFATTDITDLDFSIDAFGGGGLAATGLDIARFYDAIFRDEVFHDPEMLGLMLQVPDTNLGLEEFGTRSAAAQAVSTASTSPATPAGTIAGSSALSPSPAPRQTSPSSSRPTPPTPNHFRSPPTS